MGCGSTKGEANASSTEYASDPNEGSKKKSSTGEWNNRSSVHSNTGEEQPQISAEEQAAEEAKMKARAGKNRRQGVAAQAIDNESVKDYKKPVYPKSEAVMAKLRKTLKDNEKMQVLFGHLDTAQLDDVILAFYPKEFAKDSDIIKQGDAGDCLYIIDNGSVDVFVNRPGSDGVTPPGKGPKAVTLGEGALFGELALMYNAPRAATVTAASAKVAAFALDATDFKMLLAQSSQAQYAKYEGWLGDVEMLKVLNNYELSKLADALHSEKYNAGDPIIKQGDMGEKFYILEEGSAAAFIDGDKGQKEVKKYERVGDYFGEIALLTSEPRKATVKAAGKGCSVVSLSKDQFTNMLGPITDKLRENADKYPQYANFLNK
jgi:cAMP-dependent protein kinase regulator